MNLHPPPPSLPAGASVWAYLRDSGGPNQDRSVTQQRDEIVEYCQKHGLILERPPYADVRRSGGTTVGRKKFDEMVALSATESLRPDGLLIWNFARFARDVEDSQFYKSLLRKRGLIVHSLTDDIPQGPYGPVVEMLVHVSDEHKRHEASLGAQRGLHSLVRQGAMPGTLPKGFKAEPMTTISELGVERQSHRWVPDPDLVPVIQKAWALRAAGASLAEISRQTHLYKSLNCYTTHFCNPIYIGELHYADQVYKNYCEPMIDRSTWEAVQLLVRKHAARQNVRADDHQHPRRLTSSFLLSGLAKCARCQSPLYGQNSPQKKGSTDYSYRCSGGRRKRDCALPRIPAYALEQAVLSGLQEALADPVLVDEIYQAARKRQENWQNDSDRRRKDLLRQRSRIRGQLSRLTNAIAEAGHSQALLEKLAALEKDLTVIETELSGLDRLMPSAPQIPGMVLANLKNFKEKFDTLPLSQRQAILRQYISAVRVDRTGDQLTVQLDIFYPGKEVPPPFSSSPPTVSMVLHSMGAQTPPKGGFFIRTGAPERG